MLEEIASNYKNSLYRDGIIVNNHLETNIKGIFTDFNKVSFFIIKFLIILFSIIYDYYQFSNKCSYCFL